VQLRDGSVVRLDQSSRGRILQSLNDMSTTALRVLGFAYKEDLGEFSTYDGDEHPAHERLLNPANYSSLESELIFVGLAGIRVSALDLLTILILASTFSLFFASGF
jgi:P-type Ca2+ transporter type 2C